MADVGIALRNRLKSDSDVASLVNTRIYPGVVTQGATQPYIIYGKTAETFDHAMRADPNISSPRYQVSSYSTSYSQARELSKFVKNSLRDFSGDLGSSDEPLSVQRIFFEFEMDMSHRDLETFEVVHHVLQDYVIWYSSS